MQAVTPKSPMARCQAQPRRRGMWPRTAFLSAMPPPAHVRSPSTPMPRKLPCPPPVPTVRNLPVPRHYVLLAWHQSTLCRVASDFLLDAMIRPGIPETGISGIRICMICVGAGMGMGMGHLSDLP